MWSRSGHIVVTTGYAFLMLILLSHIHHQQFPLVLRSTFDTQFTPLGPLRLKVVEFVRVLISTGSSFVLDALIQHDVYNLILDLLFAYQWHNVLHVTVLSCIDMTLSMNASHSNSVGMHLLKAKSDGGCGLLDRLLDAFKEKRQKELRSGTSNCVDIPCGNDGTLIKVANSIKNSASSDDQVQALLKAHPTWLDFENTALAAANALESHLVRV